MKTAKNQSAPRSKHPGFNHRTDTYSLSRAKAFLGRLTKRASRGESVYIMDGRHRFLLQPVPEIEPIPIRPVGYFQLDEEDLALDKRLASANIIPNPNLE